MSVKLESAKYSTLYFQGFINVSFFCFLDERENRVRVTNCQSRLSPTQFLNLRRRRHLSSRPPSHGGPNFLFLELVSLASGPIP